MQKSELQILVVEDDPTLVRAIEESLKRSGYSVQVATNYNQAKSAAKITDFHGVVADCMLPQKSGVEVALEIMQESSHDVVVVLTSGVFKDKSFSRDAQIQTRARAFLNKPFDIQELVSHFDNAFSSLIDETREPLFQLLAREQYSPRDKISAINHTEYTHGYDLPFIYTLLLDPQISGQLQIQYDDDKPVTEIGFHRGRIDMVQHPDSESYFGILLTEMGFTTPEELQEGLNQQNNKRIGERLVDNSTLSPHAIELVQHEQMVIRLSKTIQDNSAKITFIEKQKPEPDVFIDSFLHTQLLSDWICSKISLEWLRSFYTPWLENPVMRGVDVSKMNLLKSLPACSAFADFLNRNNWPHSLQDLLSQNPSREEEFLRGVHFFLLQRALVFGNKKNQVENSEIKLARLQKILANLQGKNHFEVLGVSTRARPTEINRAYHELAKSLHPDKLGPQSPNELKQIAQSVFSVITEAYQTLNNEKRRKDYLKTLEVGLAEEILKSESAFEEALSRLKTGNFRDARKIFERTMKLKGHRSDTVVFFIWALIKEKRKSMDRMELAERVKSYLIKVPHEDRHSAQYFFIKGMHYELNGQVEKAYQYFKHSLTIDPSFSDPKREILYIKQHYGGRKSQTFTDDLSQVVTKFFKKKTG